MVICSKSCFLSFCKCGFWLWTFTFHVCLVIGISPLRVRMNGSKLLLGLLDCGKSLTFRIKVTIVTLSGAWYFFILMCALHHEFPLTLLLPLTKSWNV